MTMIMAMAAAAVLAAASPAAKVDDLAWMAGQWSREEGERWTEESWTFPRGGVMLGHSRSGRGDALREFEFLRIAAGADGVFGGGHGRCIAEMLPHWGSCQPNG